MSPKDIRLILPILFIDDLRKETCNSGATKLKQQTVLKPIKTNARDQFFESFCLPPQINTLGKKKNLTLKKSEGKKVKTLIILHRVRSRQ